MTWNFIGVNIINGTFLNQMKNDPPSCERNLCNCRKKSEQNSGLQRAGV